MYPDLFQFPAHRALSHGRVGAQQLLERETEQLSLDATLERVRSGHGQPIVLEGAPGTGKSALTEAGCRVAKDAGTSGSCAPAAASSSASTHSGSCASSSSGSGRRARRGARRLLTGAAAPAEWVLAPDPAAPSDRAGAGFAVINGIYWLAINLAVERPLLLVVDDAHWADASSLRALNFLAARAADAALGVLAAFRPAEPGAQAAALDELRAQPDALRLTVGPLHEDSVTRIVRDWFPFADDALCEACHAASAGNPLYLEELLDP